MQNEEKENNFIRLVRICLAKPIFDFLFDNNLLICCKNLTNIFIPLFVKNIMIPINIAIDWTNEKKKFVQHLFINDANNLNQLLTTSSGAVLQSTLNQLTFGDNFNKFLEVGELLSRYAQLSELTFGWDFNQFLEVGVLPSTLIQLTFGYSFNQRLNCGVLPSTLKSTYIRMQF